MQAFSSRPDVIPPSYLAELEKLQDRIPPFPDEDAYAVIGAEMGVPASALFSELTASPIAAASLGQASARELSPLTVQRPLELPVGGSPAWCGSVSPRLEVTPMLTETGNCLHLWTAHALLCAVAWCVFHHCWQGLAQASMQRRCTRAGCAATGRRSR